jgi:MSHA biogenesis protein MshM
MPYLQQFGLTRHPFDITPNRDLFFPDAHQQVLAALTYALARGEGIIKVVGEVGTGKTLLCRMLLQTIVDRAEVAFITAPRNDPDAIAHMVCREFGVTPKTGEDPYTALAPHLMKIRQSGKSAILVLDEAQALDRTGLETVRLLSNFETDDAKLLQIVLFGQPELDQLLRQHDLRQLSQRISFGFKTGPFDPDLSARYIQHRIDCCTEMPKPHRIFAPAALKLVAKESGGIPRLLNILADRAMLAAYSEGAAQVTVRHVRRARAETNWWPAGQSLFARLLGRFRAGAAAFRVPAEA